MTNTEVNQLIRNLLLDSSDDFVKQVAYTRLLNLGFTDESIRAYAISENIARETKVKKKAKKTVVKQ